MAQTDNGNITDIKKYRTKKRKKDKKKRGIFSKILFLIFVLAVLFGAYYYREYLTVEGVSYLYGKAESFFLSGENSPSYEKENLTINFTASGKNTLLRYKKDLLILSTDGIRKYNDWGKEETYIPVTADRPVIETNEKYTLLYSAGGTKAYVIYNDDILKELSFPNSLTFAKMTPSGRLVSVSGQSGYKGVLTTYDADFEEMFKWYSAERLISDADLSQNNSVIAAAVISTDKSSLSSTLLFIDASTGETLSEIPFGNEYIAETTFKSNSSAIAVTDSGFRIVSPSGNEKNKFSFDGEVLYKYNVQSKNSNVFMTRKPSSNTYHLQVFDDEGEERFEVSFDKEVVDLSIAHNLVSVVFPDEVKIYSLSGEERSSIALDNKIEQAVILTPSRIAVADAKSVKILSF